MGMGGQHDPVRFGFRTEVYALWTATFAEWKPAEGQIRSPLHARRDRPNGVSHVRFTRTHRPVWRGPPAKSPGTRSVKREPLRVAHTPFPCPHRQPAPTPTGLNLPCRGSPLGRGPVLSAPMRLAYDDRITCDFPVGCCPRTSRGRAHWTHGTLVHPANFGLRPGGGCRDGTRRRNRAPRVWISRRSRSRHNPDGGG